MRILIDKDLYNELRNTCFGKNNISKLYREFAHCLEIKDNMEELVSPDFEYEELSFQGQDKPQCIIKSTSILGFKNGGRIFITGNIGKKNTDESQYIEIEK